MKIASAILFAVSLVACAKSTAPEPAEPATGAEQTEPAEQPESAGRRMFIECPADLRGAEMCTEEYAPVCGQHADESPAKTYSNVCNACKDPNVTGYFTGACETGETE
jgi:hypothetical protein